MECRLKSPLRKPFLIFAEDSCPVRKSTRIALFVGTVIPRKQVHLLIEALVDERLEEWSLVIVGRLLDSKYVETIRAFIEANALHKRVLLTGPKEPASIPFYLGNADVYVSASEHEGRPNSVIEAIACSLPLVLSDIEGHRELVESYEKGFLFKSGNSKELARQLANLDQKSVNQTQTTKGIRSWKEAGLDYLSLFESSSKR